jgi:hypothetical protein
MAESTVGTETTAVCIIPGMARVTTGGSTFENIIDMAIHASYIGMQPYQLERKQAVINICRKPACRRMAGTTIGAKTTAVCIIPGMAGVASGGGALVNIVDMAAYAGDICVQAFELEREQAVINSCGKPTGGSMAGPTICSQNPAMWIILSMASVAVSGCPLENVIYMAFLTGYFSMQPYQLENR